VIRPALPGCLGPVYVANHREGLARWTQVCTAHEQVGWPSPDHHDVPTAIFGSGNGRLCPFRMQASNGSFLPSITAALNRPGGGIIAGQSGGAVKVDGNRYLRANSD
jgi:hypothetical protein